MAPTPESRNPVRMGAYRGNREEKKAPCLPDLGRKFTKAADSWRNRLVFLEWSF